MKKEILALTLAASLTAGCASVPLEAVETSDIFNTGKVTQIELGGMMFLKTLDVNSDQTKDIRRRMKIQGSQSSRGSHDADAPRITSEPARIEVRVAAESLSNDGICDSHPVEGQPKYIGAVAIGGQENAAMVIWPKDNPGFVYTCSFKNEGPKTDDGIVIFTSNIDR